MTLKVRLFATIILLLGAGVVSVIGQISPAEIKISATRADKVQLYQEQAERIRLEQQLAIEKLKASPEWRALEDRQKQVSENLVAELSASLREAGVEEKDFDKYTYDSRTLTFVRRNPKE